MKVTNEEKFVIRFLKINMKKAEKWEKRERMKLIEELKEHSLENWEFEHYNEAREMFFSLAGMYESYVDDIRVRILNQLHSDKS